MSTPLVRVRELVKTYGEGNAAATVLDGVSLDLPRGETTSLVGRSGSGKTTLLSLMAGLIRPDSGSVVFDGQDIVRLDDSGRARLRGTRIAVVRHTGNVIPFLTALENVRLALELAGMSPGTTAEDLLAELGLVQRLRHMPDRLSGGETQRVGVAMALARHPKLLLADEVTGELDPRTAEELMEVVFAASEARGLTVLYVTHHGGLAARAPNRLHLADGAVSRA